MDAENIRFKRSAAAPAVLVWLSLTVLLVLSGCDGDETEAPAATDTGAQQGDTATGDTVTGDTANDTTADTLEGDGTVGDVAEDGDADAGPLCFADRGERPVGSRCARETDRVCLEDSHCRDTESCDLTELDDEGFGTCRYQLPEPLECPGGSGCADNDGALRAGFAARPITPLGYEEPRPEYIDDEAIFIGDIEEPDTFFDCGRDMVCPDDSDYSGPDADGSEGDGVLQGAWLAGFDHSRSALRCPPELLGDDCEAGAACCAHPLAHDDLWAQGVIFEQGESKVAIVSVDLVGYFYTEIQRITERLPDELGLDLLIVTATHDHEAPDAIGQWGPGFGGSDLPLDPGRDPVHMQYIQDQILALLEAADDDLQEVDLYAARVDTGTVGLAIKDGRDPWIFDDDLAVLQAVRSGGSRDDPDDTVGVIVNWGSHPESMSDENPYITSDFPGYARHYIETGFPEITVDDTVLPAIDGLGGPVVYISGAVGGIIGPLGRAAIARDGTVFDSTSWEKTDAIGQQIALATFRALEDAEAVAGDLSFGSREFLTPIANLQFQTAFFSLNLFDRQIYDWRHSDGLAPPVLPMIVSAVARVQIGPVSFATVPGEIFPETLTGGFTAADAVSEPVRGDPQNLGCNADLLPPSGGETADQPCLIDPGNPNPPDLSLAPNRGFMRAELPGDYLFVLGLGMDELGYLVPPFDWELDPDAPYVGEADGDHYEETNSTGPNNLPIILDNIELLWGLENDLFVRE